MKNTLYFIFSLLFLAFFFGFSSLTAQGLIVNEGSNGQGGNKEYFELLVIGSTTQTTGTVDLSGWIVDDNNSNTLNTNGVTQGHIRLKSSCFSAIPIGAIIVIYNANDKDALIPSNDETDSNNDLVYIFPHTSACLEGSTSATYNSGTYRSPLALNLWDTLMALGNNNDAFQVRSPNGNFYHGFAYGSGAKSVALPAELGGGNSTTSSGSAANTSIVFSCGALSSSDSYSRVAATSATPGAANNAANQNLIDNIRQGTFNYADWSDPNNCATPPPVSLPLDLIGFEAKANSKILVNDLTWELVKVDPFSKVTIQRSNDAMFFEDIATMPLEATMEYRTYNYQDHTPFYKTYYRLRFEEPNAPISYSATKVVMHKGKEHSGAIAIYPNPVQSELNVLLAHTAEMSMNYQIVDILGKGILQGVFEAGNAAYNLPLADLPKGIYFLRLESGAQVYNTYKFIKL